MPRLDRGIFFGTQKKDTRVKPGCDDYFGGDASVALSLIMPRLDSGALFAALPSHHATA
jgi:hypothetical protein